LIQQGEVSFNDRVGDIVCSWPAWMSDLTIEQLLSHTAGLHELNMIVARMLPEHSRERWLKSCRAPAGWRFGVDTAYAPFASWYLLGLILEELTGQSYSDFLNHSVLEPYGVRHSDLVVRFSENSFSELSDRISVSVELAGGSSIPLLAEAGRDTCLEWNPAFGYYGNARGLGTFYNGLLRDLLGQTSIIGAETLRSCFTDARRALFDDLVGREVSFGRGFMWPLSGGGFGRCPSVRSFGHSGPGNTSFGLGDPDREIVVSATFNGLIDAETTQMLGRPRLVDEVYSCIASPSDAA
jgi:CubicO group peptidase (beta-lactamase class C family)